MTPRYPGYRPRSWIRIPQTERTLVKRGGTLSLSILVTSAFLRNVTYATTQQTRFENAVEGDVDALLDTEEYENVTLLEVKVVQARTSMTTTDPSEPVIVTAARSPNERYPGMYDDVDR